MAPQAQLEESANDRSKPEEPISRVLMRTPGSGIGPVLGRFPEYRKHFEWSKRGPRPGSDEPDFLCLCVCVSVFFVGPVFDQADTDMKAISLKRTSKNGDLHGILKGRCPKARPDVERDLKFNQ